MPHCLSSPQLFLFPVFGHKLPEWLRPISQKGPKRMKEAEMCCGFTASDFTATQLYSKYGLSLRCITVAVCLSLGFAPFTVSPVLLRQRAAGAGGPGGVPAGDLEEDRQGSSHLHAHQLRRYEHSAHKEQPSQLVSTPPPTTVTLLRLWSKVRGLVTELGVSPQQSVSVTAASC